MQIEWNGRTWDFDASAVTMKQAFVIKDSTKDAVYPAGRSLSAWQNGLNEAEPLCVRAAYWLMLQQAELPCPIADLEFPAIKFNNALVEATLAEAKAIRERQAAEAQDRQAEAVAAVPTSAPSAEPGSPRDTTREPQPASAAAG